jgi:putative phosphoribosyl transferase
MYFESRAHAGQLLAASLTEKYRYENCAVVALSDGAVLVGEKIATSLHCVLMMLLTEEIAVPGENQTFGAVSQDGRFTYNGMFSAGEIEEYASEFHGYLDDQKREAFQKMNRLLGDGGIIDNDLLRDHTVILVSDGLDNGASLEVAIDFLKPVRINRLIVATPTASVAAVDRMHILADELHILDVKENFMGTNHYFTDNMIPTHEQTIAKINEIVLNWR